MDDPYEEDLISKYDDPDYNISDYEYPSDATPPPRPPTPDPYAVLYNLSGYPCLRKAYPGCVGPQSIPTEIFLNIMEFSIAQAMRGEKPQEFIVEEGYVRYYRKMLYCVGNIPFKTTRAQSCRFRRIRVVSQVNSRTRDVILKHYMMVPLEKPGPLHNADRYIYICPEMDTLLFNQLCTPALENFGYLHELFQRMTTIQFTYADFFQPSNARRILMLFAMPALKRVELSCGQIMVDPGDEVGWKDEFEFVDEDFFPELAHWDERFGDCLHAMWLPLAKRGIELVARDREHSKIAVSILSTPGGPLVKLLEDPKKLLTPK